MSKHQMKENRQPAVNYLSYILAFFIPVAVVAVIYGLRGVWPFGDAMYLRSDMYHQYAPFHKELWRKLTEGGSLAYSWDIGMGVNFISVIAYYLASPTNLLLLLVPEAHITTFMDLMIMVKIGLSGLTFCIYLSRHFNKKSLIFTAFSVFYALSSYTAAFCWNLMWWDCIILFPLIMLGIERLVKEKKCFLYGITLGLAIFSNYYIGIMLCIASVLYFFILLLADDAKKDCRYILERLGLFGLFSLLAGGLAACMILPEYHTLMLSASNDSTFPAELNNYFSILDMMSRSLINVEPSVFMAHEPNLYCGILIFVLMPLYIMGNMPNKKEKAGKLIFAALLLISFNMNIPNYIWHGFHYPNSLACRESFIYIFLLLAMSCEAFLHLKDFTPRQIGFSLAFSIGLFLIIEKLYVGEEYNFTIIYISLLFACLYAFVANAFKYLKPANDVVMMFILIIVVTSEAFINMESTGFSVTTRSAYLSDNAAISTLLTKADASEQENSQASFYRVEKMTRRTKNDAAWHGYYGISTFLSTANVGVTDFLAKLGMEESYNAYSNYGSTPLTNAIFSVKYLLGKDGTEDSELTQLLAKEGEEYLYENLYTLPIGFVLPGDMEDNWYTSNKDPFIEQNNFIKKATGTEQAIFNYIYSTMGSTAVIDTATASFATEDDVLDLYLYSMTSCESLTASVYDADGEFIRSVSMGNQDRPYICHIGNVPFGYVVRVTSDSADSTSLDIYAYALDTEVFKRDIQLLQGTSLTITDMDDTNLEGTISVRQDGCFFTSIPYETGWHVYVDGEEAETHAFENAFLSFYLTEGNHIITMEFYPTGLTAGLWISGISLFILILLGIAAAILHHGEPSKKTKRTKPAEEEKKEEDLAEILDQILM